jgi:predicted P-loop ATPase
MKKFMAYFAAVLFVGVISLSILAFTDNDPKKQKSETATTVQCDKLDETATTEQCDKQKEAATESTQTKPCCKQSSENASTGCQKSAECKNHSEATAEAK